MSKNLVAVALFASVSVASYVYKSQAIEADESLKAQATNECKAFSEVPRPVASLTLRRYKQEDKGQFASLRQACEKSIASS